MGQGYLIADWIITLLVTFCALAHVAILRAPDISESKIIEHIRYIKVGGLSILTIRFWYIMVSDGDLMVPAPTEIGLSLFLAAEFYRTVYRLFQNKMDTQYEKRSSGRRKS
jgi:hypothetical protein